MGLLDWLTFRAPDPEVIRRREAHYVRHFGEPAGVLHPTARRNPHVDVYPFRPTAERPFWTLVTGGMSDEPQPVPPEIQAPRRIELVLYLPEQDYWGPALLQMLGGYGRANRTVLGPWHTLPLGGRLREGTELTALLLAPNDLEPPSFGEHSIGGDRVTFLTVVPITERELTSAELAGSEQLYARLAERQLVRPTNIYRASVV